MDNDKKIYVYIYEPDLCEFFIDEGVVNNNTDELLKFVSKVKKENDKVYGYFCFRVSFDTEYENPFFIEFDSDCELDFSYISSVLTMLNSREDLYEYIENSNFKYRYLNGKDEILIASKDEKLYLVNFNDEPDDSGQLVCITGLFRWSLPDRIDKKSK